MKIESFRELLLKKAEGDSNLQCLIKYSRDEIIMETVLETLEKMARSRHKGDAANFAVRDFATEMDPETEPHMIRDALGHHVSHYKAALNSNRPDLANQHAKQAFKIMNMADIAQKHSGGKLSIEHVSPHPWERNKYTSQYDESHPKVQEGKYKKGDFVTKTKGLNYKGGDFSHLQQAPHKSYEGEVKKHGHLGAYPFEQTRINGKYIPIDDKVDLKGYEEHPLDQHPILNHFDASAKNRTPEEDAAYVQQRDKYYNDSPHIENFFNKQSAAEQADPEAYAKSGSEPGQPVHKSVEPLKITDTASPRGAAQEQSKPAASTEAKTKNVASDISNMDLSSLDPKLQAQVMQWAEEAKKKGGKE